MRFTWAALPVLLLGASHASGQSGEADAGVTTIQTPPPVVAEGRAEWSFSASVYFYQVPDASNYAQPTFTADHHRLHLEARYNYEELRTGSVWMGYNFGGGERVVWELTPMLGGVFGDISAIAPGYKGKVAWRRLGFSSEGEYVFDIEDSSANFVYNWSELAFMPAHWWRVGLVTQRTRVYATKRDLQRGLLVGITFKGVDASFYLLNPDDSTPVVVAAVAVSF